MNRSKVSEIQDEDLDTKISIYPNPIVGKDKIEIIIHDPNIKANVLYIYNALGEVLQEIKLSEQPKESISLEQLYPGVYLFKVLNNNMKVVKTQKIVIL